jgi:hypothetical protein
MATRSHDLTTPAARPTVRGLLIVARDQGDLYEALQDAYGDSETITVLVDRRLGDRRRSGEPVPGERRRRERRGLPNIDHDLRCQQYVLVRPHARRPHD